MKISFKAGLAAGFIAAVMLSFSAQAGDVAPNDVAFSDDGVTESLSGKAGDAAEGRKTFMNRKQGNCLACHENSDMPEQSFHGEVGPSLDGVADRYNVAEMRAIVTNAKKAISEDTIMPGFYSLDVGVRVLEKFAGKTILSAQQVEDIVAYLATLKE